MDAFSSDLDRITRHRDWSALRDIFVQQVTAEIEAWVASDDPHFGQQLAFATGRLTEGFGLARYFEFYHEATKTGTMRVLDIGSGNGGVAVGMSNSTRFRVTTLDLVPNHGLLTLKAATGLPIMPTVGDGTKLPFHDSTFDLVLLLETIEHVPKAGALAEEIMRVLKPGGSCMITTPARVPHLLKPDPHYGVRGLLFLPDRLQEWVVSRVSQRRFMSRECEKTVVYDVDHIYWHAQGITKLFPRRKSQLVIHDFDESTPMRRLRARVLRRLPALADFFWTRIILVKE